MNGPQLLREIADEAEKEQELIRELVIASAQFLADTSVNNRRRLRNILDKIKEVYGEQE